MPSRHAEAATAPTGRREAELWLGSHPGSPARILDPASAGGHDALAGFIDLPFLLKVLAAASPLSLQAHPTTEQAREGFARENAAGIALDAPTRNYRDASAKPELIVAVADGFEALCGFREPAAAREVFELIAHRGEGPAFQPLLERLKGPDPMRAAFRAGRFGDGLGEAIQTIDGLLRTHFPLAPGEANPNELPDRPLVQ